MLGIKSILWVAFLAAGILLGMDSLLTGVFSSQPMGRFSWMVAGIFMGPVVTHWPAVFDFGAISAAWVALWIISIGYVAILVWLILPWNWHRPLLAGAMWGLICYFPSAYGYATLFPWLTVERNWMTLLSYIAFGAAAAWILVSEHRETYGAKPNAMP